MLEKKISKILEEFDELGLFYQKVEKPDGKYIFVCQNPAIKQFLSSSLRKIARESVEDERKKSTNAANMLGSLKVLSSRFVKKGTVMVSEEDFPTPL